MTLTRICIFFMLSVMQYEGKTKLNLPGAVTVYDSMMSFDTVDQCRAQEQL